MVTKDNLFSFKGSAAETKAATTDKAFRAITDAEAKSREAKTARLKKARLEQEVQQPAEPAKPKARKTKKSAG